MATIGILASGSGSNFQAIAEYLDSHRVPARVALVLTDNPSAGVIARAERLGIPCRCIPSRKHKTFLEPDVEEEYVECLRSAGVDLVCLAGFMRVLKKTLLEAFAGRVVNIHPSLLPAFPGLEAWRQALDYGVRFTGCTVHFVDEGVDTGPIIMQAVVPVLPDDTPASLHARIQEKEHLIYPLAVRLLAEGRVKRSGRRVILT